LAVDKVAATINRLIFFTPPCMWKWSKKVGTNVQTSNCKSKSMN